MIDLRIIEACKKQERRAQRVVYDFLLPRLYHTCKRYIDNDTDAEDVLAEIFVIIYTKIHQLEAPEALVAWSRKIAVRHCMDYLKRHTRFDELTEQHHAVSPALQPSHEKDLHQLVGYLPAGSKLVFNLAVVEGYSHKEIADLLQISEGTSKSQLHYAKHKLKTWLEKFYTG